MASKTYISIDVLKEIITLVDDDSEGYVPISALRQAMARADKITITTEGEN